MIYNQPLPYDAKPVSYTHLYNIAAIKHEYEEREVRAQQKQAALTDADVRRILHDELLQQGRFTTPSQQFGNLRI